ncbi:hypothetical protein [Vibrio parahaemolyticus]|uniref:hypothetical protein n=1 Tax=Vibrio parahaemolyticus TaxID=670 RepID=UPI00112327A0|nr:hypothetical protein [Vibrio parahaemolyticus]TOF66089.1 hypothetical protein CGJ19_18930 [Vibrio parahaemolyticus]
MFKELYSALSALTDRSVFATKVVKQLVDIEALGHKSQQLTVDDMADIRSRFIAYLDGDIEALHKLITIKDRLVVKGERDIKADVDWLLKGLTFPQLNHELTNGLIRTVTVKRSGKGASIKNKKYTIKDFMGKK